MFCSSLRNSSQIVRIARAIDGPTSIRINGLMAEGTTHFYWIVPSGKWVFYNQIQSGIPPKFGVELLTAKDIYLFIVSMPLFIHEMRSSIPRQYVVDRVNRLTDLCATQNPSNSRHWRGLANWFLWVAMGSSELNPGRKFSQTLGDSAVLSNRPVSPKRRQRWEYNNRCTPCRPRILSAVLGKGYQVPPLSFPRESSHPRMASRGPLLLRSMLHPTFYEIPLTVGWSCGRVPQMTAIISPRAPGYNTCWSLGLASPHNGGGALLVSTAFVVSLHTTPNILLFQERTDYVTLLLLTHTIALKQHEITSK